MNYGEKIEVKQNWLTVFNWINTLPVSEQKHFAFGALFYDFLKENNLPLEMSIYNPDIYSGYRMLNDNFKTIYKSSYELKEKNIINI